MSNPLATDPHLKPCPFCGGVGVFDHNEGYHWCVVICTGCGVTTSEGDAPNKVQAALKWNVRVN